MKQALYVKPTQFEPLEARIAPASFAVDNISDDVNTANSLRWAVNQAYLSTGADTITFADSLEGSTITLNSTLFTSQSLTIKGLGSDKLTINGNGNQIFFAYDNGTPTCTTLSISGLKLTNADNAIWSSENLILTDTILSGNSTAFKGGGIYMLGSTSAGTPKLIIKDSQIFDNQATGNGGGIYAKNVSDIQITNSIISGNTGAGAGGIFVALSSSSFSPYLVGKVTIKDSQITNNTGGGFFSNAERANIKILNTATSANDGFGASITLLAGTLTVDKSSFVENTGSGLISVGTAVQSTTLKNSVFSSNGSHGIDVNLYTGFSNKSSFTADKITVANNGDSGLKGIFTGPSGSAAIAIKNSEFLQNKTATSGGGIQLTSGNTGVLTTASILNSQISGNTATVGGGGLDVAGFNSLTLSKATVVGNSSAYGGGIASGGYVTKISTSTFTGNHSSTSGGAVFISSAQQMTFDKNVFDGNSAANGGGAIFLGSADLVKVNNSIFTGNSAIDGGAINGYAYDLIIQKCTFLENTATTSGGAVYVNPGVLLISGSTFSGNTGSFGGAVRSSSADGTIGKSTFSKNFASISGGAVYNSGTLAISSSSIVDNVSLVVGGGVSNAMNKTLSITGGTITGNVATQSSGGGIYASPMALATTVTGTKVTGNSAISPSTANASLGVALPTVVVKSTAGNFIVNDDGDLDDGDANNGITTLREALNLAYLSGKPATIGFDAETMAGQTILLASELAVKSPVKIVGLGTDQLVIHGNNATGIFSVYDNFATEAPVIISGLTLTHGDATFSGAAINSTENLTVSNVVVMNCASDNDGAGIYSNGKLAVSNSKFVYNICGASSSDYGGAILAVTSSSVTISNSLFAANAAGAEGGAIKLRLQGAKASILIDNSALLKNNAGMFSVSKAGAGAYISGGADSGTVTIKNTLISGNDGGSKMGGGIYLQPGASGKVTKWTLDNVLVSHNTAGKGGGLAVQGAYTPVNDTLIISKSKFLQNDAVGNGGAINISFPVTAVLQSSLIAGNTAADGGGLRVDNTDITMTGMKFFANTADTDNGGGVSLGSFVNATITGSSFIGNKATGLGGGLHANYQDNVIAKSVNFLGNSSGGAGGGLSIISDSTLDLSSSKITGNYAVGKGGGLAAISSGNVILTKNSVLANASGNSGGGMHVETTSGNFTMTSGSVSSNFGSANGGGVSVVAVGVTTATINGTSITRNVTSDYGGGLSLDGTGAKFINKATITENFTPFTGGGIYLMDGSLVLTSGLISHNMANVAGGGFGMTNSLPLTINGTKFSQNFAPSEPNISPAI